jgi:hypothetical protein
MAIAVTSRVRSVNGQSGAVTLDQDDVLDGVTYKQYSDTEKTKLAGIDDDATANALDSELRDRSTHTGTQLAVTISDIGEAIYDAVAALVLAGSNITLTPNDTDNTLTIEASGSGGGITLEEARDAIGTALVEGSGIDITVNDGSDTITVSVDSSVVTLTGTQTLTDKTLTEPILTTPHIGQIYALATDDLVATFVADATPVNNIILRTTETGTAPTITSNSGTDTNVGLNLVTQGSGVVQVNGTALAEYIRDIIGTALVQGGNTTITVNDGADTITVSSTGYVAGGTDVALADGGTGASLVDPGADRILFWDDSAGVVTWLTPGTNLAITGTSMAASGGGAGLSSVYDAMVTYLAVGDGSNDDTAEIQAAIDACAAAGGGIVWLGEGTFKIGAASVVMKTNVILRGVGRGTILQLAASTTGDVIKGAGTNAATRTLYAGIEDLVVDGNKANQSNGVDLQQYGIGWQYTSHSWVRNVWVINTQRTGIFMSGEHNLVENCYLTGIGKVGAASSIIGRSGIVFETDGTNAGHNRSINNRVMDCLEHGCKIYPTGHNSQIIGGYYNSSGDFGVWIDQADDCLVDKVRADANLEIGIYMSTLSRGVVTGCIANDTVDSDGSAHGIQFNNVTGGAITGNVCDNNGSVGIRITGTGSGTQYVTVSGNSVTNNDDLGIYEAVGNRNNIVGNVCYNNGSNSSADNLTKTGAQTLALSTANVTT